MLRGLFEGAQYNSEAGAKCAVYSGRGVIKEIRYIYVCVYKKIVIERTRDLIYLKFVATDFFKKIISPSAGENSGDLA